MDLTTKIYSKTGKGTRALSTKPKGLPTGALKVLPLIDSKSDVATILAKLDKFSETDLLLILARLERDGYIRAIHEENWGLDEQNTGYQTTMIVEELTEDDFFWMEEKADTDSATVLMREETEQKAREAEQAHLQAEAEKAARLEAERIARETAEREAQAKEEIRRKAEETARLEAERQAKETRLRAEAEMAARLEAERIAREAAEHQARKAEEARLKAEAEVRAQAEKAALLEAERLVREAAERKAREEAEQQARMAEEARMKAEAKARAEAEKTARLEAERQAREAEEARLKAEAEAEVRALAEKNARLEAERLEREEAERQAREEEEARRKAEAERKIQKEAEQQARIAEEARLKAETDARAEADRIAQLETERIAREAAERQAKESEDARLKAEAEARALTEKAARLEAERLEREEAERQAREEEEVRRKAEAERKIQEEAERQVRIEEEARLKAEADARAEAENTARLEAERIAREAAERKAREAEVARREAEARAQEERTARLEAERIAREAKERESLEEKEARRKAEAERKAQEDAERQARKAEEARLKAEAVESRRRAKEEARSLAEEKARQKSERKAQEQADRRARKLGEAIAKKRNAPDSGKQLATIIKAVSVYLPATLILIIVALHFVNLAPLGGPIQKMASEALGEPVRFSGMHASLFPKPQLLLSDVAIGTDEDMKVASIRIVLAPSTLFDDRKSVDNLEIAETALATPELGRTQMWFRSSAKSGKLNIARVSFKNVTLTIPELSPIPFDGHIELLPTGEFGPVELNSVDRSLSLQLQPENDAWKVTLDASSWQPPLSTWLKFDALHAEGYAEGRGARFDKIDGRAYGGTFTAKGVINWAGRPTVSGNFKMENFEPMQILTAAGSTASIEGRFDIAASFTSASEDAGKLMEAAEISGRFTGLDGKIGGVDLSSAMLPTNREKSTRFDKLTGSLQLSNGIYRYRNLALEHQQFRAQGSLDIQDDQRISGNVNAQLNIPSRRMQASFGLGGTVENIRIR
ncbi:MAG: AsmA-like C-terminal region-containing protein [Methylophilaceae bacterium]